MNLSQAAFLRNWIKDASAKAEVPPNQEFIRQQRINILRSRCCKSDVPIYYEQYILHLILPTGEKQQDQEKRKRLCWRVVVLAATTVQTHFAMVFFFLTRDGLYEDQCDSEDFCFFRETAAKKKHWCHRLQDAKQLGGTNL